MDKKHPRNIKVINELLQLGKDNKMMLNKSFTYFYTEPYEDLYMTFIIDRVQVLSKKHLILKTFDKHCIIFDIK